MFLLCRGVFYIFDMYSYNASSAPYLLHFLPPNTESLMKVLTKDDDFESFQSEANESIHGTGHKLALLTISNPRALTLPSEVPIQLPSAATYYAH